MDFLLNLLNENQLVLLAAVAAFAVTGANLITMFFPSVKDNAFYNGAMKILNMVSMNVGKNKNADDK